MKNGKTKIDVNQIALSMRKSWGNCNPVTKVYKSKRDYNRKDKSWMKEG